MKFRLQKGLERGAIHWAKLSESIKWKIKVIRVDKERGKIYCKILETLPHRESEVGLDTYILFKELIEYKKFKHLLT